MTEFKAYDAASNLEITDFIMFDDPQQTIIVQTEDTNLVGKHTIEIKAIIPFTNEEQVVTVIDLEIVNACDALELEGSIDIQPVTVNKGEPKKIIQSFDDVTIAAAKGKSSSDYNCGPISYLIVDSNG